MGAGKGYLTFAAYEFFRSSQCCSTEMTGVEGAQELVALCQCGSLDEVGFERLRFLPGRIANLTQRRGCDLLIALHACDTATDDALHLGLHAGAVLLVAAPCCHKEVRPQIDAPPVSA